MINLPKESNERKHETIRVGLQQQMVRSNRNYALPQQKGPLHGEDKKIAAENLLSGVRRREHVRRDISIYSGQIPRVKQVPSVQGYLFSLHLCHRYREC